MKLNIEFLSIYNVGPFRGTHSIDMKTDGKANGYSFFAENGRGKTTIYNALKWCLFGEVRTRAKVSRGSRIDPKIRPIVGDESEDILMNRSALNQDDPPEMSVLLIANGENGNIQVHREVRSKSRLPRSDKELEITTTVVVGSESTSGPDAQELIETFFPESLQRFFFIDGEALEEYTDMLESDNVDGLKDDVEAILRLPALSRGKEDLDHIRMNIKGNLKDAKKGKRAANRAQQSADMHRTNMEGLQKKVNDLERRIDTSEETLEETIQEISQNGEMAAHVETMRETDIMLKSARLNLERSAKTRVNAAADSWKTIVWNEAKPMYKAYEEQVQAANDIDWEIRNIEKQIADRTSHLREMDGICGECGQKVPDVETHIEKIRSRIAEDEATLSNLRSGPVLSADDLVVRLGRLTSMKPQRGDIQNIREADNNWKDDRERVAALEEEFNNLSGKVTKKAVAEMGQLGERKGKMEQLIRDLNRRLKKRREELNEERSLFDKFDENTGVDSGSSRKERKLDRVIGQLISTVEETISSYRISARKQVQKESSEVFMEVTNSPATYSGISLDDDFRAGIRLKNGKNVTAPSSGMKSMMTISIIDGLRRVSGLQAPIFFDTPGRSIDERHRQAMLNYFWRDHGNQFLIFAHSGEFKIEETLDRFGTRMAKAWKLTFPGDHRTCLECDSDDVMHSKSEEKASCMKCKHEWDTSLPETIITELEV